MQALPTSAKPIDALLRRYGNRPLAILLGCILLGYAVSLFWLLINARHGVFVTARPIPVGADFQAFWSAGRLALEGNAAGAYQMDTLLHTSQQLFPGNLFLHAWAYPPSTFLLLAPLAALPYHIALALWTTGGMALYIYGLKRLLPNDTHPAAWLVVLSMPITFMGLLQGQSNFLWAGGLALGLAALRDNKAVLAGICFGLLSLKPQLGIALPFCLLAAKHYRCFTIAAATTLGLLLLATLLFGGIDLWHAFLGGLHSMGSGDINERMPFWKMPTFYSTIRLLEGSHATGILITLLVAIALIALTARLWRQWRYNPLPALLALPATCLLLAHHTNDYDYTLLALPIALLITTPLKTTSPAFFAALLFSWLYPVLSSGLAKATFESTGSGLQIGWLAALWIVLWVNRKNNTIKNVQTKNCVQLSCAVAGKA